MDSAKVVGHVDPRRLGILPPFPPLPIMVGRALGPQAGFAFMLWVETHAGFSTVARLAGLLGRLAKR